MSVIANNQGVSNQVAIHEHVLNRDFVHFLLSKKSTTLDDFERINQAIKTFRGPEDYNLILSRYGLKGDRANTPDQPEDVH